MSSKQAPLFVTFENSDGEVAPDPKVRVLFKQGDDLRQDFLTLQALQHMEVGQIIQTPFFNQCRKIIVVYEI